MTIDIDTSGMQGIYIRVARGQSEKDFQQLIQRGANLWPDAPPEIKEFADKVTNNGKVLQDYYEQNKDKRRPVTHQQV